MSTTQSPAPGQIWRDRDTRASVERYIVSTMVGGAKEYARAEVMEVEPVAHGAWQPVSGKRRHPLGFRGGCSGPRPTPFLLLPSPGKS